MPASRPPQDRIDGIVDRLLQAISDKNFEPLGILELADRTALIDLCETDSEEPEQILDRLRGAARSAEWTEQHIKRLSFKRFRDAARDRLTAEQRADKLAEGAVVASRRTGTRNKARQPLGSDAGHDAKALIDQDGSLYLIAVGQLLGQWRGHLWFDDFHMKILLDRRPGSDETVEPYPIDDSVELSLVTWLHLIDPRLGRAGFGTLIQAIRHVAFRERRNEPRDWLHALPAWDGVDRLRQMLPQGFGTMDNEYHQEVGRAWMVSMVARIQRPGEKVDTVPVLLGPEGTLKSQALEVIGGKFYRAATASMTRMENFLMQMWGCVIFDIPEMHSFASGKMSDERAKHAITDRMDHFRAPYDRLAKDHPRRCVWTGSSNQEAWFHGQGPGRRFWPFWTGKIDLSWLTEQRDQLWAQALACWRLGSDHADGCWWNVPETARLEQIEEGRADTEYDEPLRRWLVAHPQLYHCDSHVGPYGPQETGTLPTASSLTLAPPEDERGDPRERLPTVVWGTLITSERLAVEALGMTLEMYGRNRNQHKISEAMQAIGYRQERRRIVENSQRVRFWVLGHAFDPITLAGTGSTPPDGEIPF